MENPTLVDVESKQYCPNCNHAKTMNQNATEATAEEIAAIDYLTTDDLDAYTRFVTGSNPRMLAAELPEKLRTLDPGYCREFFAAIITAATTQKGVLTDWLSEPIRAGLAIFIRANYYLQDHINFTALNMMGHCVMASRYTLDIEAISAFRDRIGGDSIWHSDYRQATISDTMLRIFQERKTRFPIEEAIQAGNDILAAILTRAGVDPTIE